MGPSPKSPARGVPSRWHGRTNINSSKTTRLLNLMALRTGTRLSCIVGIWRDKRKGLWQAVVHGQGRPADTPRYDIRLAGYPVIPGLDHSSAAKMEAAGAPQWDRDEVACITMHQCCWARLPLENRPSPGKSSRPHVSCRWDWDTLAPWPERVEPVVSVSKPRPDLLLVSCTNRKRNCCLSVWGSREERRRRCDGAMLGVS